jgi:hypothetical protein
MSHVDHMDAVAVLIVRLAGSAPSAGELTWSRWDDLAGHASAGIEPQAWEKAHQRHPYKKLPGASPYFMPHVERALFPPQADAAGGGGRWISCPRGSWLDVTSIDGTRRRSSIDLIERIATPLEHSGSIGLIHLSWTSPDRDNPEEALRWASDVRTTFAQGPRPHFELSGELTSGLPGRRPVRSLVQRLFGDPADDMDRRLFSVFLVREPAALTPPALRGWQSALARRWSSIDDGVRLEAEAGEKAARQRRRFGPVDVIVVGSTATFSTASATFTGKSVRNLRSYWAETIAFGLLQQDGLQRHTSRVAALGVDPSGVEVDRLHADWLTFRNLLWWSHLSSGTDVTQDLIHLLRAELGTEELFSDLQSDFEAYTAHRRQRLEAEHTRAINRLQTWVTATAVLGAVATLAALLSPHGATVIVGVILACLVITAVATLYVRRVLTTPRAAGPAAR